MSLDERLDRRVVDGAAAPWREPELGVQLTEEAREYEALLCSKETQRIYGGPRYGRSPTYGLATRESLLDAPPGTRRVATRNRGVFTEVRVLDHPGRVMRETIVHLRWTVGYTAPIDCYTARCEFYAPRQYSVEAPNPHVYASDGPPSRLSPPEEFETELQGAAVDFQRSVRHSTRQSASLRESLSRIAQEVGRAHGNAAGRVAARGVPRILWRFGINP